MAIRKRIKGSGIYLISLLSIILWSMSYLWSDRLIRLGIPVEYFVFVRILVAGLLLLLYNLIVGNRIRIRKEHRYVFVLLAVFEPLIYFVCETHGIALTGSPTFSSLIIATSPIFSMIVGVLFFREKVSLLNVFGMLVCLGGIVMVTLTKIHTGEYLVWGMLLLGIAIISEVGHASCTKYVSCDYKPEVIVMYQFLIGAVLLLPLFLFKGLSSFDRELYFSWEVFSPILYLAVLCSSVAFSLWVNTIKWLGVARSSIFMAVIPVFTALDGWVIGREVLSPMQAAGIAVACIGVILSQFVGKSLRRKAKSAE